MAPSWRTRSEAPKGRAARGSVSPRKVACRATLRGGRLERSKATGSRTGASPVAALTIEPCDMPNGTDMTPHIPENLSKVVRRDYGQCAAAARPKDDDDDDDEDEEECFAYSCPLARCGGIFTAERS
jgi:hypothetical protein